MQTSSVSGRRVKVQHFISFVNRYTVYITNMRKVMWHTSNTQLIKKQLE